MIFKIVNADGKIFGVYVYENNYNGDIAVMDTFKVDNIEESTDDLFGSNEKMLTLFLDNVNVDCIVNLEDLAKDLVNDNKYLGKLDGESFDLDLDKVLENIRQNIVELALDYANEECLVLCSRGL